MTCERAADDLRDADRRELEGRGETRLARHVSRCEACRARAEAILAGTDRLGRALDELAGLRPGPASPGVDDRKAARRAVAAARERRAKSADEGPKPALPPGARSRPGDRSGAPPRSWIRAAVPLAAAAVLTLIYVVDEPPPPPGGWQAPGPADPAVSAPVPSVDPGEGAGTVAVFETSDPDITVVWFFQEE